MATRMQLLEIEAAHDAAEKAMVVVERVWSCVGAGAHAHGAWCRIARLAVEASPTATRFASRADAVEYVAAHEAARCAAWRYELSGDEAALEDSCAADERRRRAFAARLPE